MAKASQKLWFAVGTLRQQARGLAVLTGIADGSLPADSMARLLLDEAHSARMLARAWSLLAARTPAAAMVNGCAAVAQTLLDSAARLDALDVGMRSDEPGPAAFAHGSFAVTMATLAPVESALTALTLPLWLTWDVANAAYTTAAQDTPWRSWIDVQCRPAFGQTTERAIGLLDEAGDTASPAMEHAARRTMQYQVMMWEQAVTPVAWP